MLRSLKLLPILCLVLSQTAWAQEINVLTDLDTPFPPGCISLELPEAPAADDPQLIVNEPIDVPNAGSAELNSQLQVMIWRMGCADEGYSVVMIRLENIGANGPVLVPQVYAEASSVTQPVHPAQLVARPAPGDVGAAGNLISQDESRTYMLTVQREADGSTFGPEDYNEEFTLELYWGAYTGVDHFALFDVGEYLPEFDPPQTDKPILNGRFSGQYVVEGLPRQGLVLQVAETADGGNYHFAIFFTYLDGELHWIGGNTEADDPGATAVTIEMFELSGGQFVTAEPGSYTDDDITQTSIGEITLEAENCNRLTGSYDFTEGGFGTGTITFDRLIRIAGYDCNPWE